MKTFFLILTFSLLLSAILVPIVYASPEYDYPENKYDKLIEERGVPVPACHRDGYIDGRDNPYDGDRSSECDFGEDLNPYYEAFINGCLSVEGNTEEICESATD